jgi:integrase
MSEHIRKVELRKRTGGKSPYWYVRWFEPKPDGGWKERWESTKTTIRREADKIRRQKEHELSLGKVWQEEMSWAELVKDFLERQAVRMRPTTHGAYEMSLKSFTKFYEHFPIRKIKEATLEDFTAKRLGEKVSAATVNKDLRHVRAVLRWAHRRKYLGEPPRFTDAFIREDKRRPVVMPEEEFRAILAAGKKVQFKNRPYEWWRVFLYLAYYTGLRRGELLGLAWDDIHLDDNEIVVRYHTSKGRKERLVPINPDLTAILKEWRAAAPKEEKAVLPWSRDSLRNIYDDWHAMQKAAGIADGDHYVPKHCRSSCASLLIAAGVPTAVVKDFLGHEHITTTEMYYVDAAPALRAAANARPIAGEICDTSVTPDPKSPVTEATNSAVSP